MMEETRTLRNLVIEMSLCFFFLVWWSFVTDVNAAELTEIPPLEVEAIESTTMATTEEALSTDDLIIEEIPAAAGTTETTEAVTEEVTETEEAAEEAEEVAEAEEPEEDPLNPDTIRMGAINLLSRLIQVEGGITFEDKVCVALTVLHRVDSDDFPDDIAENIYKPLQYATPTDDEVTEESLIAAEFAMELWENGLSYAVLPSQFLYFYGDGTNNTFHDAKGHTHKLPEIDIDKVIPYLWGPTGPLFLTFLLICCIIILSYQATCILKRGGMVMKRLKNFIIQLFAILLISLLITQDAQAAETTNKTGTIRLKSMGSSLRRMEAVEELSRLIEVEGGDAFEDKVCVALTVLHRVDSDEFPDDVIENIYKPSQYAKPSEDRISDLSLAAAEYAVRLWETGISYSVLPGEFLYFSREAHKNSFHDYNGHHYEPPKIEISSGIIKEFIEPYSEGGF